ncbi:EAL domain-containing protein [Aurantimonas sp. MSK8Z-1]|uniref:sensor domain-containing phosphodiesterase n=1 Tax=Mangrovibrevibacter kandeliae TaxID=2968473 RepID=UPI002117AD91|nr:EAL domain-containing protein [Aurantimonas sp. MSK8Z-1]MCW4114337.1 EAL domain-containing protein [Aurantimonas sp. MSK8Z-1]
MPEQRDTSESLNEAKRLQALDEYAVLGTEPEKEFDDLVAMARRIFAAPIALISLVASDHQYFKARIGLDLCQTSRDGSFCTHAVKRHDVLVVLDAAADERFASSPLVSGEPHIRFYAGAPLTTPDGFIIGSFCIKDTDSRSAFSDDQQQTLQDLARLAMERLEARKIALRGLDSRKQFDSIAAVSADAIICADASYRIISWNRAAEHIFGYTAAEAIGQSLTIIVPLALRASHEAGIARFAAGHAPRLIGKLVTVPALRRDGTEFPIELSLSHWTEGGKLRFGAIARDVTDRQEAERRLKREADFDYLTEIANRKVLTEHMRAAEQSGTPATLMLIDLDGFKDVNDSLGHAAGDRVLKIVAQRLGAGIGDAGLLSRLGGDEFAVFIEGAADPISATSLGDLLIAAIEQPVELDERCVYVGASAGVAVAEALLWRADDLLADADLALYAAKSTGRSHVRLFTPELRSVVQTRTSVSSGIREAWERQELEMYYQPQVRLSDREVSGAEALIRWNHPDRGLIAPAAFLPYLEASLLAVPVSEWILRTACEQASIWRSQGHTGFRVGVNLFTAQFRTRDLPDVVDQALRDFGLPGEALELEITENIILHSDKGIKLDLAKLREMGVGIAFDDYGTGFASLTMLKDYPVTRLKIDRSFISTVDQSARDQTIVNAIAELAKGFELEVIAEGIETEDQAVLMKAYCSEGQGYLFGKPQNAENFEQAFITGRSGSAHTAGQRC